MNGSALITGLGRTLGFAVVWGAFALATNCLGTANAQTAKASSCAGLTVTAAGPVRPDGQVLLSGHACNPVSSYATGGTSTVRVNLLKGKRWAPVAIASTDRSGNFSTCAPVHVTRRVKTARLQAIAPDGGTATVLVRVYRKAHGGCHPTSGRSRSTSGSGSSTGPTGSAGSTGGGSSGGTNAGSSTDPQRTYANPIDPPANPDCPLAQPGSTIGMTLPSSCTVVASDTASNPNSLAFWGKLDCQNSSRAQQMTAGGDTHLMASGQPQGDVDYRQLSVIDGDDTWGERCEMGYNWHKATDPGWGITGPGATVFYHEGERRVTYMSIRLPNTWDVNSGDWRVVMQMKQVQPYDAPQLAPMISLDVLNGVWYLENDWTKVWTTPVTTGVWTRWAFDVTYSNDPSKGSIKAYVDLNNDGDFNDPGEQSPLSHRATLRTETAGPTGDVPVGHSIPSHLRAGVYQNPDISCPAPAGCHDDIDNVQVVRP